MLIDFGFPGKQLKELVLLEIRAWGEPANLGGVVLHGVVRPAGRPPPGVRALFLSAWSRSARMMRPCTFGSMGAAPLQTRANRTERTGSGFAAELTSIVSSRARSVRRWPMAWVVFHSRTLNTGAKVNGITGWGGWTVAECPPSPPREPRSDQPARDLTASVPRGDFGVRAVAS